MKLQLETYTYQEKALFTDDKYSCFIAGRQTGKTHGAVIWILENLLLEEGKAGLWLDTRNTNIEKYVERYFYKILKPIWHLCKWQSQKKVLTLLNGSFIDFGSAENPEALEGFNYDYAVLNEAGIILKKDSLWYNTVQPMTKKAKVRFIGTPKGKNLFHTLTKQYPTYKITAYESGLWEHSQLDMIRQSTPETIFRQEYLAEFMEGEGTVFRNIRNCIINKPLLQQAGTSTYCMGIDLAKSHDFTVITIADENTKEIVYFDRFNQLDWTFQKQKIFEVWRRFNQPYTLIDSTGVGNPIFDDLKSVMHNIHPYQFTNTTKKTLVEGLMIALENQQIFFPEIKELIDELESFEINVTNSGTVTYNAPQGLFDDIVMSLGLTNNIINQREKISFHFLD
jgi:hypothetical protein